MTVTCEPGMNELHLTWSFATDDVNTSVDRYYTAVGRHYPTPDDGAGSAGSVEVVNPVDATVHIVGDDRRGLIQDSPHGNPSAAAATTIIWVSRTGWHRITAIGGQHPVGVPDERAAGDVNTTAG